MQLARMKDTIREVRNSLPRFVSILIMMLLGSAFFVGMQSASPSMLETARHFFAQYDLPDGKVVSDMGLDSSDVSAFMSLQEVEVATMFTATTTLLPHAEPIKLFVPHQQTANMFEVMQGRMPQEMNELALDIKYLEIFNHSSDTPLHIGDSVTLEQLAQHTLYDETHAPSLTTTSFKIVGFVKYVGYFERISRETQGNVSSFAVISEKALTRYLPTELYYWAISRQDRQLYTEPQDNVVRQLATEVEQVADTQSKAKYERWQQEITQQLEKLQQRYQQEYSHLQKSQQQLEEGKQLLDTQVQQAKDNGTWELVRPTIDVQLAEYNENMAQVQEGFAQVELLQDGIAQYRLALQEMKRPTYYVTSRLDERSYTSVEDNAKRLTVIGYIFPLFFVGIAVFVVFSTVKRMTIEQRLYMGTMKQLGYPNRLIVMKFVWYATSASIIGATIGSVVGYRVFPKLILNAYNTLYYLDSPIIVMQWSRVALSIGIAVLCALFPALWTPYHLLTLPTRQLLTAEPPKVGRMIWLERCHWLWRRFSFEQKMTLRNIFRYKGRSMMTFMGVAGCTMLLIMGFGIKDSIQNIPTQQFEQIQRYDSLILLKESYDMSQIPKIAQEIQKLDGIAEVFAINVTQDDVVLEEGDTLSVQRVTLLDDTTHLDKFVSLTTPIKTAHVVLSRKLYESVQSNFSWIHTSLSEAHVLPTTHYVNHVMYMLPHYYEKLYGESPKLNALYVNYEHGKEQIAVEQLKQSEEVAAFVGTQAIRVSLEQSLKSLDALTLVLIVSAASLAVVVLYNLMNINISERLRELATIKVLGMYRREVNRYIFNELWLLVVSGIVVGFGCGTYANYYLLKSMEVAHLLFEPRVEWISYVYAAMLTAVFAIVVMFIMERHIHRVNMVEALKGLD